MEIIKMLNAILNGTSQEVKQLLYKVQNINEIIDNDIGSYIHYALLEANSIEKIKILLTHPNIDLYRYENLECDNFPMLAVMFGDFKVIKAMVESGKLKPQQNNSLGLNIFNVAKKYKRKSVIKFLKKS